MKKLISLFTITSVIGSTILTSNSGLKIFDSPILNNINLQNNNLFPFINHINSIDANEQIKDVVVADNSTIYASSANNLFTSDDSVNYKKIYSGQINSIAVSGKDLYVATSTALLISFDDLEFIKVDEKDFTNTEILKVTVAKDGTIYVATSKGLYQSFDGKTFNKISDCIVKDLAVTDTGAVYIIHENELDIASDGKTFNKIYQTGNDKINSLVSGPQGQIYLVVNSLANDYLVTNSINNTFTKIDLNLGKIYQAAISANNTVILATDQGLYQSTNNKDFTLVTKLFEQSVTYLCLDLNRRVFFYVPTKGFFQINILEDLLIVNQPDYDSALYDNDLIYNKKQLISFRTPYLKKAVLDNTQNLDVRTTNLPMVNGKHSLDLTLNDNYKQFLNLFGADPTKGVITYNFQIKDTINNGLVNYLSANSNTKVITGLVSNAGNTNGCDVVQTRVDPKLGDHPASLRINITDTKSDMIDYTNSYYISGTVNTTTNDFSDTSQSGGIKYRVTKDFTINDDGIYHFHLVDFVGNSYDSYLELGAKNNDQLRGTMQDNDVATLAKKLNVTTSVTNPADKPVIMKWLQTYQATADQAFNAAVQAYGKEFNITISDLPNGYCDFLDPITYSNPGTIYATNQDKLRTTICNISENDLNRGIETLQGDAYNVDTRNVVDKNTLNNYSIWLNNYKKYLNENKPIWINNIAYLSTRGFGNHEQIETVKNKLWNNRLVSFDKILTKILWNNNFSNTNFDYSKLVNLNFWQSVAFNFVNSTYPNLNKLYQNYLANAENQVDMYGYSLDQLLGNNPIPQTKDEIDNYQNNKSFSIWLQQTAIDKYHNWRLTMGLSIGLPLFFLISLPALFYYWKYTAKYNPREYKLYKRLQKIDSQRFREKKKKKKKTFLD